MNNEKDNGSKLMDTSNLKRVRIEAADGRTTYCVAAWPGRQSLKVALFFIGVFAFVEAVMIFMHYEYSNSFGGDDWFSRIARFAAPWPVFVEIVVTVLLLLSPLMVIGLLSSKKVWVDGGCLHVQKKFLFRTRHKRIPLEDILELTLGKDGSDKQYFYKIYVKYRPKLPLWLESALPKNIDSWAVLLLDAIPSKEEADFVHDRLLEEIITVQ